MKVIILAGGIGKRYNLGEAKPENIPKCLAFIKTKHTILDLNLKILLKYKEIEEILIVTGFKYKLVQNHLKLFYEEYNNISTIFNPRYQDSVIYSVKKGFEKINKSKSVLLLNGDTYFHKDIFLNVLDISNTSDDSITIFGYSTKNFYKDDMLINVSRKKILDVGKNINNPNGVSSGAILLCNGGLKKYLEIINTKIVNNLKTHHGVLQFIISKGFKINFVELGNRSWVEIDNKEDIIRARKHFV